MLGLLLTAGSSLAARAEELPGEESPAPAAAAATVQPTAPAPPTATAPVPPTPKPPVKAASPKPAATKAPNRQHAAGDPVILARKGAYDRPAPHGGQLRTLGEYHLEWVLGEAGKKITVYLTDAQDRPSGAEAVPADIYVKYAEKLTEHLWLAPVTLPAETIAEAPRAEGARPPAAPASPAPSPAAARPDAPEAWTDVAFLSTTLQKMGEQTTYTLVLHITLGDKRYDLRFDYPLKPSSAAKAGATGGKGGGKAPDKTGGTGGAP
jgi:hypothetical protein